MSVEPADDPGDMISPLWGFDFTRAWLEGDERVRAALPPTAELLKDRVEALDGAGDGGCAWEPWTAEEVEELRLYNLECGNPIGAAMCEALADPAAAVVVTGQQPNLLVSPLYILYKALSAVAWSRRLSQELGRRVTPVFWVASDDDDFAELKQAWMPGWGGELVDAGRRIGRGRGLGAGSPAYQWNLADYAERLTADVRRALEGWPGGEQVAEELAGVIAAEPNFERNFCRLLAGLLGEEFSMVFVAPRLRVMRRRGARVLASDVKRHGEVNRAVTQSAETLTAAGYPVSLSRDEDALNLFWLHGERRCRLVRAEDQVVAIDPATHREVGRFSEDELLERLRTAPEEFAPNVVTRPVVQDTALPTLVYLGGPGELAYLAVLGEAYRVLDCARSAVATRTFVTLDGENGDGGAVSRRAAMQSSDLLEQDGELGAALHAELQALTRDVQTRLQAMEDAAGKSGVQIEASLARTEKHILRGVGQLKQRLARQVLPEAWEHHARAAALYHPAGKQQERMLAPWTFVRPGEWDLLARHLYESVDFAEAGPFVIDLPPWMEGVV